MLFADVYSILADRFPLQALGEFQQLLETTPCRFRFEQKYDLNFKI